MEKNPFQNLHCYRPLLINCSKYQIILYMLPTDAEFTGVGGRWKESMFSPHCCFWTCVSSWFSSLAHFWGTSASQPWYFSVWPTRKDRYDLRLSIQMKEQPDQRNVKKNISICVQMVSVVQSMHARATLSQVWTSTVIPQFTHPDNCPYSGRSFFLRRTQFLKDKNPEKNNVREAQVGIRWIQTTLPAGKLMMLPFHFYF